MASSTATTAHTTVQCKTFNQGQNMITSNLSLGTEVWLYGAISEEDLSAAWLIGELQAARNEPKVTLRINSPGGSVGEGQAMIAAVRRAQARGQFIHTIIDSAAFSMAGVLAQVGDKRSMAPGALLMIHLPYTPYGGNAVELAKSIELLKKVETQLVDIFIASTGQDEERVRAWLADETWFVPQEALSANLIDEIVSYEVDARCACNGLDYSHRIPGEYKAFYRAPVEKAVADVESWCRSAVTARSYSGYDALCNHAANAARPITSMPAATTEDLARVGEALDKVIQAKYWPRDQY
jgi:ATP-dependent protease ClpP protease subunit